MLSTCSPWRVLLAGQGVVLEAAEGRGRELLAFPVPVALGQIRLYGVVRVLGKGIGASRGWPDAWTLSNRNTGMLTTSCLRTTQLQIASSTSGGRQETSISGTCTAGTRSTRTSLWASAPRSLPSTNPPR